MLVAYLTTLSRRAVWVCGLLAASYLATPSIAAPQKTQSLPAAYQEFHALPISFLSQMYPKAFIRSSSQLGPIFKRCSPLIPIDANYEALLATYQMTAEIEGILTYQEVQAILEQGAVSGANLASALSDQGCEGFLESFMRHDAETTELLKTGQSAFMQSRRYSAARAPATAVRNTTALITVAQACDIEAPVLAPYKELARMQATFIAEEKLASQKDITHWQEEGIELGNSQYGPMGLSACQEIAASLAAERARTLSFIKYNQDPQ